MSDVRVGVIGIGHLGGHHARAWSRIDGARLVGGYDPSPQARERAARELGLAPHETLEPLLDAVDVVSIAAPTERHAELAIAAIHRGLHVLVEKPMAARPEEGERMLAAAQAERRALLVGHVERYNPAVRAALPRLKAPRFIEAHRLAPMVPRGTDVDVILDLMIHDLDLALLATRSAVVDVQAVGVPVLTPRLDIANARIAFASGCVANVTASRVSREKVRKIRFFESREYLSIDCLHRTVEAFELAAPAGDPAPDAMGRIRPVPMTIEAADPLESELRHFLAACARPESSWSETRSALEALRLADRIRAEVERLLPEGALA